MMLAAISANSQTFVKIGELELALKSPISITKEKDTVKEYNYGKHKKGYRTYFDEFYIGYGQVMNTSEETYMPVYFGNSYNLEIGWKYFHRPAKFYAIGTSFRYTSNSFRLTPEAVEQSGGFFPEADGEPYRQFFRTDNLGTSLINRVYLYSGRSARPVFLEFGAYADYAFSKRYKVKSRIDGDKVKSKYRDGSKFNPVEAGLNGGIGYKDIMIFAKYRMTNYFNKDYSMNELPRWSVGVQFNL